MTNYRHLSLWSMTYVRSNDAVRMVLTDYGMTGRGKTYPTARAQIFDVVDDQIYLLVALLKRGAE